LGIAVLESNAAFGQGIYVWSFEMVGSITTHIPDPKIVCQDKHNIRFALDRCGRHNSKRDKE
jgi:hypothetical protein